VTQRAVRLERLGGIALGLKGRREGQRRETRQYGGCNTQNVSLHVFSLYYLRRSVVGNPLKQESA
jgi:hypothetical protein